MERFKDEIVSNDIKSNHEGLQGLLLEAFQSVDEDGAGMLPQMQVSPKPRPPDAGPSRLHCVTPNPLRCPSRFSCTRRLPRCSILLLPFCQPLPTPLPLPVLTSSPLLQNPQVKRVLQELSYQVLGLSSLQLITLLSHAPTTADGMVSYLPFVPVAAATIYSMYDVDKIKLRIQVGG